MTRGFHKALAALALATGMALVALVVAPAASAQSAQIGPAQRGEIESIVRDYLLKNPEVLRDALIELDRRVKRDEEAQRLAAVEKLAPKIFNSQHQVVVGNPKGSINLVEFYDYNCGYCKRALDDITRLIKANPDLRVVLKEFPVLSQGSMEAAMVASALRLQVSPERFWTFHQKLMGGRGQAGRAQALAVAKEIGADMARLNRDMESDVVRAGLRETMEIAETLGINGTPSFVLGREVVVGAVGAEVLQTRIANVRKCGKAAC